MHTTPKLVRIALRSSLRHVRHITPVSPRHADGVTAEVYRQVERDFGMLAPPIALHSPAPAVLAAAWAMLRESLVVTTTVPRAAKEAVATAVSMANACPYCVEVHSATLTGLSAGEVSEDVIAWARAGGAVPPPFPTEHVPQLIAVAAAFHYLNRVVHVFLGDSPLPPGLPAAARGPAARFVGRVMRAPALRGGAPGESAPLLADAPLPADLAWAASEPHIARAFAGAAAVAEKTAVAPAVRDLLAAELSTWDVHSPGVSRSWADPAVRSLPERHQPAGRLALLVAKAPYQVTDDDVTAYRDGHPTDEALVELVAWAALSAARHAGSRLATAEPTADAA